MPIYPFYCEKCGHNEEIFLKMSDVKPSICPCDKCGGSYIRDYSNISAITDASKPKTIGDLADKNTENLVREGKLSKDVLNWDTKRKEIKKKKNHMNDIAKMSPTQKTHYIMTGEKKT